MPELVLDVRLDGYDAPAGYLARDENGALGFVYSPEHLATRNPQPLSLSLPLTDEPFGDVTTRAFFDNLLQERDGALAEVMAREGLARDDIAGILAHMGKDCPGALSVLPKGAPPVKVPGDLDRDYTALAEDKLIAIVTALHERRELPDGTGDPSPLAGVQSKIALVLLPDGNFGLPKPGTGAPTTHILKVPDRQHLRDAALEAATLDLSRALGIETTEARALKVDELEVLLITRFDRARDTAGRVVRLHQEDFAQALGLPAALKYERNGREGRRFDIAAIRLVLDATLEPAQERERFIRSTVFDLLTGNVDAHAKNHALMHLGSGRVCSTPRYDLLPTRLDPNLTDELPFKIGAASRLDGITAADFDAFLAALGIATPAARKRLAERSVRVIADGLVGALKELNDKGMKLYADLIAANVRQLLPVLNLPVPDEAQNRDAFVGRGGGWQNS